MNRHIIKVLALAAIVVFFASCKKSKSEWTNFYGYTPADVAGTYVFSALPEAFEGYTEGTYCILCKDAQISISGGENTVRFNIDCPDHDYSKSFLGKAPLNPNDFLIDIRGNVQSAGYRKCLVNRLQTRVLKNDENKIRLAGAGIKDLYNINEHYIYDPTHQFILDTIIDTTLFSSTNYYFDVIKE